MFNVYINDEGRVIYATKTAYDAIYRQQGFKPRYVAPAEDIFNVSLSVPYTLGSSPNDLGFSIGTPKPAAKRKKS